jgi:DNA-binding transcriptional LysR family regulator
MACVNGIPGIVTIHKMDIAAVDLNLLAPLDALLEERHVSRAADRLHMSQPAMSRALRRLRDTFGDELLVRRGANYVLTSKAERVQEQLGSILPRLESLFSEESFDPRSAGQAFRLAATDYVVAVVGAPLLRRILGQSPRSTLRFEAWHHGVFFDVERGALDLVLAGGVAPPPLRTEEVFKDHYVCALSADHPLAGRIRLSIDDYLTCDHVVVDVIAGRQGAVDQRLDALGTPRQAAVTVPYHAFAASAVSGTTLVATLPSRFAARLADDGSTRVVGAPVEFDAMTFWMGWHPRVDNDPVQRWLRDMVRTTPLPR